jgi:hypothetical protein
VITKHAVDRTCPVLCSSCSQHKGIKVAPSQPGFTPELRRQMVTLHQAERLFDELARQFGPSCWSIRELVKLVCEREARDTRSGTMSAAMAL